MYAEFQAPLQLPLKKTVFFQPLLIFLYHMSIHLGFVQNKVLYRRPSAQWYAELWPRFQWYFRIHSPDREFFFAPFSLLHVEFQISLEQSCKKLKFLPEQGILIVANVKFQLCLQQPLKEMDLGDRIRNNQLYIVYRSFILFMIIFRKANFYLVAQTLLRTVRSLFWVQGILVLWGVKVWVLCLRYCYL